MSRKTRFWIGFVIIVCLYAFPLAIVILLQSIWGGIIVLAGLFVCIYLLHRFTIGKVKPTYPLVPPEGKPDVYTGLVIPRPIYEDMEQHPWFFKKKHRRRAKRTKKGKKK